MIPVNCEQKSLTKRFRLIRPRDGLSSHPGEVTIFRALHAKETA